MQHLRKALSAVGGHIQDLQSEQRLTTGEMEVMARVVGSAQSSASALQYAAVLDVLHKRVSGYVRQRLAYVHSRQKIRAVPRPSAAMSSVNTAVSS